MPDYPHHSAEEMKRFDEIFYQDTSPSKEALVVTCTKHKWSATPSEIQKFLAESNLRTLAWARDNLIRGETVLMLEGSEDYKEGRNDFRNDVLEAFNKCLTPESL